MSLVARWASQPLSGMPSQSAKPALQVMPQTPLTQLAVPLFGLQTWTHPPQFWTSDPVLVSQPVTAMPSQSLKPARQA